VGTSSPGFPDIHAFPDRMPLARSSHRVRFPPFQSPDWALANTGSQAHFFGGDDRIELFDPGGASPVATRSLSGVFVPPGGVTQVYLPLAGLPLGPYVVQTRWLDPGLGTNQVVRHGIGGDLDLHFPGGRSIPRGGSVPVWIGTRETPTDYAFALSLVPGTGVLPRGCTVPLVPDVLVAACLRDGAGGLVSAFAGRMRLECAGPGFNVVEGIRISHPGPAFSGLVLHAAAIARLPGRSGFIASQPEEIALR
jgi:hypothetical protein